MILHPPFIITGRLLPGLTVANATISIGYARTNREGRMCYLIYIDIGNKEYIVDDIRSGCQGGNLQKGMQGLLSFLGAAGESRAYGMRTRRKGEHEDLFVPEVTEWAYQHSDEISMLALELEESPNLIEEGDA